MSKLDYLKKYGVGDKNIEDDDHKKKKKRKSGHTISSIKIIDQDAKWGENRPNETIDSVNDRWYELDKDDGPIIVEFDELLGHKHHERGVWEIDTTVRYDYTDIAFV